MAMCGLNPNIREDTRKRVTPVSLEYRPAMLSYFPFDEKISLIW
jgi:hypothetical protein